MAENLAGLRNEWTRSLSFAMNIVGITGHNRANQIIRRSNRLLLLVSARNRRSGAIADDASP